MKSWAADMICLRSSSKADIPEATFDNWTPLNVLWRESNVLRNSANSLPSSVFKRFSCRRHVWTENKTSLGVTLLLWKTKRKLRYFRLKINHKSHSDDEPILRNTYEQRRLTMRLPDLYLKASEIALSSSTESWNYHEIQPKQNQQKILNPFTSQLCPMNTCTST